MRPLQSFTVDARHLDRLDAMLRARSGGGLVAEAAARRRRVLALTGAVLLLAAIAAWQTLRLF